MDRPHYTATLTVEMPHGCTSDCRCPDDDWTEPRLGPFPTLFDAARAIAATNGTYDGGEISYATIALVSADPFDGTNHVETVAAWKRDDWYTPEHPETAHRLFWHQLDTIVGVPEGDRCEPPVAVHVGRCWHPECADADGHADECLIEDRT